MRETISWRAATHVWHRSIYLYKRTWLINMLPNFFEPVIYLLGMGVGLGAYLNNTMAGENYLSYLAPGLVVSNAMNGAAFESTYNLFVKIYMNRTYDAIVAAPVTMEDAMVGELLWATTRGTVYGTIFALVALLFGIIRWQGFFLLLPVSFLTAGLFAAVGMMFTSLIRVIDMFSFFYTLFLTPMFLFSGIFFPLDALPEWAHKMAWCTPLYHAVSLSRSMAHEQVGWDVLHHATWMVGVIAVLSVWSVKRLGDKLAR